jgi:hypothetical protein
MSREKFISVENGRILLITENESYSLASRGPERVEKIVTLESLEGSRFYEEAKTALRHQKSKRRVT